MPAAVSVVLLCFLGGREENWSWIDKSTGQPKFSVSISEPDNISLLEPCGDLKGICWICSKNSKLTSLFVDCCNDCNSGMGAMGFVSAIGLLAEVGTRVLAFAINSDIFARL